MLWWTCKRRQQRMNGSAHTLLVSDHRKVSEVKPGIYPRVCGSEVLCLLSGSVPQACWRWSRGACTDRWGAAHGNTPTLPPPEQPLSPQEYPFVQGEMAGGESKRLLEWSGIQKARRTGSGFFEEALRSITGQRILFESNSSRPPDDDTSSTLLIPGLFFIYIYIC